MGSYYGSCNTAEHLKFVLRIIDSPTHFPLKDNVLRARRNPPGAARGSRRNTIRGLEERLLFAAANNRHFAVALPGKSVRQFSAD